MQRSEHRDMIPGRLRLLIVGLIALSTILFVTGVAIEKSQGGSTAEASRQQAVQTPTDSGDPDGGHEGSSPSQPASSGTAQAAAPAETILGLDIEAPWFLAAFILGWLLLGAALFRFGRLALGAVLLVAAATVILDGGEIVHQIKEANTTLITFAVLVAAVHLVIAALAGLALAPKRRQMAAAAR
jgi:hypothetical protein